LLEKHGRVDNFCQAAQIRRIHNNDGGVIYLIGGDSKELSRLIDHDAAKKYGGKWLV
jgi:hypothetical protein